MPERKVSKNEAVVGLIMSHTVVSESQTECPQPATQGRPPHSCYLCSSNCWSPGGTEWPAMTAMERWWSKAGPWSTTQRWNKRTSAQITTPVSIVSSSMSNWNKISKRKKKTLMKKNQCNLEIAKGLFGTTQHWETKLLQMACDTAYVTSFTWECSVKMSCIKITWKLYRSFCK